MSASKPIQAVRGMNDLLPGDIAIWQYLESTLRELMSVYGYSEIRTPLVERTSLFSRAIGDVTDIVEKEMYTFDDRNGDSLSLRPEGTASCVRAGIEHGLFHNQQRRLWYMGPMFRHERPQKGRYRQFSQIGVETFGYEGPDIDLELILMTSRLWKSLGLNRLSLEINSLGTAECRRNYKEKLVSYLETKRSDLDEDSLRRLGRNPLRILDSKNPDMQAMIQEAPRLIDYLDEESKTHFELLTAELDRHSIDYKVNTRLVRGLDYYSKTVFEWTTDELGAQSAVCAGGRYDSLVSMLGGKDVAAMGFAIGLERVIELLKINATDIPDQKPDIYFVFVDKNAESRGREIAEGLRDSSFHVVTNCGGGSLKSQMKKADRWGVRYVLLLGEEELKNETVTIKSMHGEVDQTNIPQTELVDYLKTNITS